MMVLVKASDSCPTPHKARQELVVLSEPAFWLSRVSADKKSKIMYIYVYVSSHKL